MHYTQVVRDLRGVEESKKEYHEQARDTLFMDLRGVDRLVKVSEALYLCGF